MKSFIEVIKEADETQAKLKYIQDPKSSSKSIAGMTRSKDPVVRNAAEEELKRRRDSGDQDAAAHVQPPKDPSVHTAQTQVGGEQAQAQEKETKTKEVEPNRIAPFKKGSGRDILNNLRKGKTISGDAPNAIELNPQYIIRADGIKEAAMKSVVFSFGRMNPPTVGHEKLVDKIQAVAKANKADARLFLSRTEGDDKNPLPYSDKLKLAKMAFPGIVQDTPKSMYPAGFIGLLKMLEDKYDKVIIVVGSDRLANIKSLANKYNGSEYKFEEIEVVSAGERDPDEEGVGGMSASKMRAAAKAGDLAKFKSGLPDRLKSAAKLVMDKLQSYLSEDLDEAVLTLSQRLKRRSQFRRARGKIILGQKRARARKASSKQISRRSKRIAIKLIRKRILRNRKYQDLSYGARAAVDRQVARRKSAIARIAKRIEPRLRQAENRRKSGGGYASISLSGPVKKKKLKEEITYGNLIHSVNTIMKRIIAEENYSLAPLEVASLVKKSNDTGVPVKVIKEVYARGVASWNMGLREDTTPQQWGFARVNSFLAGGFNARTADRDLLEAKDPEQVKKNLIQKIESDETYPLRSLWNHTRNNDQEISDAAHAAIEARAKAGDSNAAQAADALKQQKQGAMPASQPQGEVPQPAADLNPSTTKFSASTAGVMMSVIQNNSSKQPDEQSQDGVDTISSDDEESQLFAQHASGEMTDDELHQRIAAKKMERKEEEPEFLEEPFPEKIDQISTPREVPVFKRKDKQNKNKKLDELVEKHKSSFISGSDLDRFNSLIKGYRDFANANSEKDRAEAIRYLAENNLISSHSGGKKIYLHSNVLGGMKGNTKLQKDLRKALAPNKGDTFSLEAYRLIEKYGIEIEPGDNPARLLADLSGKLHEAGIAALIHPSPENTEAVEKLRDRFVKAGGDLDIAEKQNEEAAKELRDYIQLLHEGAEIVSAQQVGGLGPNKLKELGIDPLTDPTDVIVTIKDKSGNLITKKFSFKTYDNVNNITMKNSGTDTAGETWLGEEIGKKIDEKLKKMKSQSKYIYWADDIDEDEVERRKKDLKTDYLKEFGGAMADLAKTKDGQQQLKDIWLKVHGCGKDVATLVTNKKTNKTEIKPPDYYCNPKGNFKVTIDGTKVVVNMEESSEGDEPVRMLQLDFKTESSGSTKMLWRHIVVKPKVDKRASPKNKGAKAKTQQDNTTRAVDEFIKKSEKSKKQKNESFLSFGDFLEESADKAVGNQPTVNPKPIHHKASGHKYHVHHMVNPNLGMLHQVKHAVDRKDLDIDGDTDEFDKPKAGIPDEIGVGTTPTTKKMFAKYSKELSHIHAGEPVDEQKVEVSEGPLSPIPKTDKPNLFHGNYGGKGNRGGEPVDKLDQAFQKHDTGYHYTPDSKKRLKHDKSLVKATSSIVKDKSQPIKTRVKAGMAAALFKTKLALKKNVDEQTITPKYTGDENSWYLDASGQKVVVYAQADLKQPEDVGKFLKNPTQQKDIGKMMSMTDFLKTQPEKKKK